MTGGIADTASNGAELRISPPITGSFPGTSIGSIQLHTAWFILYPSLPSRVNNVSLRSYIVILILVNLFRRQSR